MISTCYFGPEYYALNVRLEMGSIFDCSLFSKRKRRVQNRFKKLFCFSEKNKKSNLHNNNKELTKKIHEIKVKE